MAQIALTLPKLHVFFRTGKTPAQVRTEILGPLANGYESLIQTLLDNAGQTGLTAYVKRSQGKVYRDGDRWEVYLKCIVSGETSLTRSQIRTAWNNRKGDVKAQIKARLEKASFGGTDVAFKFKRLDEQEAEEET